jgi:hypothetical protein
MILTGGAKAFRDGVRDRQQPYSIFAVKLPIDDLIPELQNRFQIENWQQNIDLTGKLGDLVGVPVIKFKDSPWTVLYWSIGRYLDVESDCRSLSWRLDCRSIAIYETDRSGWVEWTAYKGRDEAESVTRISESDTEYAYFESHLRKKPRDLKGIEDKSILRARLDDLLDELLIKENVRIPALNSNLDSLAIERIDLLVLPSQPLGMRDFMNMVYQGHPECAIFAVKADIDRVIPLLIKENNRIKNWLQNIESEDKIWDICFPQRDEPIYFMPIIQPANNEWTVVYWSQGNYVDLSGICSRISSELKTSIFTISSEDTSGAFGYELFDLGREIENIGCGDEMWFRSELREEPEFDDFDKSEHATILEYINNRFIEAGIFIPTWDLSASDPWIGRIDLLEKHYHS